MKKLVKIQEVEDEGLIGLMGEVIMVFCVNYIYHGKLVGVNNTCIKLEDCKIVYETGSFSSNSLQTAEAIGENYIQTSAIESFHQTKKR